MQYNVRSFYSISSLSTSRLHRSVHSQYKCAWVTQYQQKILFGNSPPEYIMGKIVFLKGNWAAMDDLLLQFMILNHITRPVKQFTSQLTAQHAQQQGSSSAWPRGDCVQIVRQVVHAGVRSVNRCPSETFNHLHHQPWMSHFLCVHHFITAGREPPVFQHLHSTLHPFSDRWWVTCDRERVGSRK